MVIDRIGGFKIILFFAVLNSFIFLGLATSGPLRAIAILALLTSAILLIIFTIKRDHDIFHIHPYFKIVLTLFFIWSLYTIIRGYSTNSKDIISMLGHYLMGWAWITPLAIGYGFNVFNWILLFDFIGKLLLIGSLLTFLIVPLFGAGMGFGLVEWVQFFPVMLITFIYQKPFYKKVVFLAMIAFIILSIVNDQRISLAFIVMAIGFTVIEFYRASTISIVSKVIMFVLISFVMIFAFIKAADAVENISHNQDATADTRTFLFVELFQDMSEYDALVGRGALGTYFSPYFAFTARLGLSGDSPNRVINEVGYLEMILKGGYIMVALYLLVLIPAAYLGIFRSNNAIARMSGYMILIYLVIWIVSYYPVYSAEYLLLWMGVGTAISPKARAISDKNLLRKQKKLVKNYG